jgi:hypothetical protein
MNEKLLQTEAIGTGTDGAWHEGWGHFLALVFKRLEQGQAAYGDKSFGRPPAELVDEIGQELLDTAAWAFIAWARLQATKRKLRELGEVEHGNESRATGT